MFPKQDANENQKTDSIYITMVSELLNSVIFVHILKNKVANIRVIENKYVVVCF